MLSKTCLYFLTYKTNDLCEYSTLWEDAALQKIEESPLDTHFENLKIARLNGGEILEVLGGEPFLYRELPQFLKKAKSLGFKINLYTNGILYAENAKKTSGLADNFFFFTDYPTPEEHNNSRGIECFNEVIDGIKYALQSNENPAIYFNFTRDSVRFLPEMWELSQILNVRLHVHPVYDHRGLIGFEEETYQHVKYYFKKANVFVNLAELEFSKRHGNNPSWPRCMAKEATITFLPDGEQASPCFYNRKGRQGREVVCSGCTRAPYMLPSFARGFDRYRLLDYYSKWFQNRKEKDL